MFSEKSAKRFCKDDFSLIENYEQASKDLVEVWDIHHRKEDEGYSRQELKDMGMYYKRPAIELVFLTRSEHLSLHMKGKKSSYYGKHHSEKTKKKLSEAMKGEKHPMYGKKHTEESRRKMSEVHKGKTGEKHPSSKPILQIDKKTGQVIKTWPCTWEVQRILGIYSSNISKCCKGKLKSCGGYIWKYA